MAAIGNDEHNCHPSYFSANYRWAEHLYRNGSANGIHVKFSFVDNSVIAKADVESHNSFEQVFVEEKLDKVLERSGDTGELYDSSHFLGEYLNHLECQTSAEPFYTLGVDLFCTQNYYSIFENESIAVVDFMDEIVCKCPDKNSVDVVRRLFKKLHLHPSRHVLASMVNTVSLCRLHSNYHPQVSRTLSDLLQTYADKKDATRQILDLIIYEASFSRDKVKEHISRYGEQEHVQLVGLQLAHHQLSVIPGRTLTLPFSTRHESTCRPDVITDVAPLLADDELIDSSNAVPIKVAKSPCGNGNNWMDDIDDVLQCKSTMCSRLPSYAISSPLLFQVFEQMLGMMLDNRNIYSTDKTKIFQLGILVENDRVTVCVLMMVYKVFRRLKNSKMATDTLTLLKTLAAAGSRFCNLYVSAVPHDLCDLGTLIESFRTQFCNEY